MLCGPRLPHNWISVDLPEGGVAERDLVIQFRHEPIAQAADLIPELADRAADARTRAPRHRVLRPGRARRRPAGSASSSPSGLQRFAAFCELLALLADCTDYRLLSNVQMQGEDNDADHDRINTIVDRMTERRRQPAVGRPSWPPSCGMSESQFSRFFRRATGNTFTDFVNRIRVNRACQLLMESDRQVTHICYEVGFQNVANFNRRFRDIKGMTPSEFRQQAEHRFGRSG